MNLLESHRTVLHLTRNPVGRADHLPCPQAAAGQKRTGNVGPVVAAGVFVDLWRSSELAPHHHGHVFVEAAAVDVVDQCRHALVELGQVLAAEGEVAAVVVPEAVADRHAANPRLDEPAGGEELLHEPRGAVALMLLGAVAILVADRLRLLRDVECRGQIARGENAKGLLLEGVHPFHHSGAVGGAVERIERADEAAPVAKPVEREAGEDEVAGTITVGLKRAAGVAEEASVSGVVGPVLHSRGETDVGRSRGPRGTFQLRHHRTELRMASRRLPLMAAAGEALEGVVVSSRTDHRADDGEFVHHRCQPRHQFADLDAGHIRGNRLELSPHLARRVGLQIDHVLVGRSSRQINHDHGLLARRRAGGLFGPEDIGERQSRAGGAKRCQAADAEKLPAAAAVAESAGSASGDREHGW